MVVTYEWTVQKLFYEIGPDSEGHSDIVTSIEWLLTASDGEDPPHEALWSGITHVSWEEGDDWIEFADLSESDCVSWVQADIGEEEIARIEASLNAQIAEKETPTKGSAKSGGFPWNEDDF